VRINTKNPQEAYLLGGIATNPKRDYSYLLKKYNDTQIKTKKNNIFIKTKIISGLR